MPRRNFFVKEADIPLFARLKREAEKTGESQSTILARALAMYLAELNAQERDERKAGKGAKG